MTARLSATLVLFLSIFLLGGNRADVNADQLVNSADNTLLMNILAGNIPANNYNLYSIVVVAPQGGDFTDPADAADWVATQSPSSTNRFVIYVAPARYTVTRPVMLPSYTTLKGAGREQCEILRYANADVPPYGAVVVCDGVAETATENLTLYKGSGTGGSSSAVIYIRNCTTTVRNCTVQIYDNTGSVVGVWVYGGATYTQLELVDCYIDSNQPMEGIGLCIGVYFQDYTSGKIRNTQFWVHNQTPTQSAMCVYQFQTGDIFSTVEVYFSELYPHSNAAGKNYYFYRAGGNGYAYFYSCQIKNDGLPFASGRLTRVYCFDEDAAIP